MFPKGIVAYGESSPSVKKPDSLLANGKFFSRSKPSYSTGEVLNVLSFNARNDGDITNAAGNTKAINEALQAAVLQRKVLIFPAGIYTVDDTIHIPVGSRVSGALWSQIMAVGRDFGKPNEPKVLAK
jgi:hypothetical protein